MPSQQCDGNTQYEADRNLQQGAAKHHSHHTQTRSAERHANTNLGSTARDEVGHYSIQSD